MNTQFFLEPNNRSVGTDGACRVMHTILMVPVE